MLQFFHNNSSKEGLTALMAACDNGNENAVRVLLERGSNPDKKYKDDSTALIAAIRSGSYAIVNMLLQHGADVNAADENGDTPLMFAVDIKKATAKPEIMEALIKNGADVNKVEKRGWNALRLASQNDNPEIIKNLFGLERM